MRRAARSLLTAPLLVTVGALALAGCGSIENAPSSAEPGAGVGAGSDPDAEPLTVTDARGVEVSLDAPPTDVVALEWGLVENLVSLGVMPTGVADVAGYTNWVSAAPLDPSVEDVGVRGEPSIDAIVSLNPDLVIAPTDLPTNIVEQIEEFVPVLVVTSADAARPIEQMKESLTLLAEAVDRTDEATAMIAEFDALVADGAVRIEEAGLAGRGYVLADGYLEGSTVSIRMFTAGSFVGAVAEAIGLENAWTAEGDPDYGLAQTDIEGLTSLGDVEFLYYANENDGGDPFVQGLVGNAIWDSLPFVVNDDVHRLPDGIWMFGGPTSAERFIDATIEAVTA